MRPVLAVVLGGCFSKPPAPLEVQVDGALDASPPDCRGITTWTETRTEALPNFSGDPAITADQLELFYLFDTDGSMGIVGDIMYAMRPDTAAEFVPVPGPLFPLTTNDTDPQVTADGTLLLFLASGVPQYSTRENRAAWAPPKAVGGFSGIQIYSWTLTHDGQTLYFTTSSGVPLGRATRVAGAGVTFSRDPDTYGIISDFPTISGDERELYYNTTGDKTVRTTRGATSDDFPSATLSFSDELDPYLAPGDELLLTKVVTGNLLRFYERDCP